jgi:hypothetical protein
MPKAKKIPTDPPMAVEPVRVSFNFGCHLLGMSRSQGYKEVRAGTLRPVKIGNKTLLTMTEIKRRSAIDDPVNQPLKIFAETAAQAEVASATEAAS